MTHNGWYGIKPNIYILKANWDIKIYLLDKTTPKWKSKCNLFVLDCI